VPVVREEVRARQAHQPTANDDYFHGDITPGLCSFRGLGGFAISSRTRALMNGAT
jgi:hypothetical protein